eukprot:gene11116-9698_t
MLRRAPPPQHLLPLHVTHNEFNPVSVGASSLQIGSDDRLVVRCLGSRGTAITMSPWWMNQDHAPYTLPRYYYFEVVILDLAPGAFVSIGIGPADYILNRQPG